jgi:hypothetical protein
MLMAPVYRQHDTVHIVDPEQQQSSWSAKRNLVRAAGETRPSPILPPFPQNVLFILILF